MSVDFVVALISFILTILVLSYIFLGDTALFRIATYAFIGVAAGYVVVVVLTQVIYPRLFRPFVDGSALRPPISILNLLLIYLVPLLLSILLLFKMSRRLGRIGSLSMAYLVGVGAAVTIGGAVMGTLFPQALATATQFSPQSLVASSSGAGGAFIVALFVLVGVITTLAYFQFGGRPRPNQPPQRNPAVEWLGRIGQFFIALTFGSLFAGVYMAALSALVERVGSLLNFISTQLHL